jgi:16S rRNA (uracil1498-N3)-methyltransferase
VARVVRVALSPISEGELELDRRQSHYLCHVHRLGPGDRFVAFDPLGQIEADAELVQIGSRRVRCRLGAARAAGLVSELNVTLWQALGKGDRVDQVVRDATALGARRLVVVETAHASLRLGDGGGRRAERWRTIAIEAARQSGRGDLPELVGPVGLEQALAELGRAGDRRVCLEVGAPRTLGDALQGWRRRDELTALIGPEGGLSADELERVRGSGFDLVSLGPFTLRTETAATALMGALLAAGT